LAQNKFQQRETKDRHIYWNNSTYRLRLTFHLSMECQFASARGQNCVTVTNYAEIGQTAAEIWLFFDFQDGGRRHLGFSKFQIFNSRTA